MLPLPSVFFFNGLRYIFEVTLETIYEKWLQNSHTRFFIPTLCYLVLSLNLHLDLAFKKVGGREKRGFLLEKVNKGKHDTFILKDIFKKRFWPGTLAHTCNPSESEG